jgi:hypothetical protein
MTKISTESTTPITLSNGFIWLFKNSQIIEHEHDGWIECRGVSFLGSDSTVTGLFFFVQLLIYGGFERM